MSGQQQQSSSSSLPRTNLDPASGETSTNRRSSRTIASRLFQFALSGPTVTGQNTPNSSNRAVYQSMHSPSQQESYHRLREHLFPASAHGSPAAAAIPPPQQFQHQTLNPRSAVRTGFQGPTRLQQLAQASSQLQSAATLLQGMQGVGASQAAPPRRYLRDQQRASNQVAAMHPSFRSKAVCQLGCTFCEVEICKRGMRAILLADTSVRISSLSP